jgi:hypothetical protein
MGATGVSSFAALGGAADGIVTDSSVCPMPCTATPMDPSLGADRQHDLTDAAAVAFFDQTLKGDAGAQRFLAGRIATENPEVTVRLH